MRRMIACVAMLGALSACPPLETESARGGIALEGEQIAHLIIPEEGQWRWNRVDLEAATDEDVLTWPRESGGFAILEAFSIGPDRLLANSAEGLVELTTEGVTPIITGVSSAQVQVGPAGEVYLFLGMSSGELVILRRAADETAYAEIMRAPLVSCLPVFVVEDSGDVVGLACNNTLVHLEDGVLVEGEATLGVPLFASYASKDAAGRALFFGPGEAELVRVAYTPDGYTGEALGASSVDFDRGWGLASGDFVYQLISGELHVLRQGDGGFDDELLLGEGGYTATLTSSPSGDRLAVTRPEALVLSRSDEGWESLELASVTYLEDTEEERGCAQVGGLEALLGALAALTLRRRRAR